MGHHTRPGLQTSQLELILITAGCAVGGLFEAEPPKRENAALQGRISTGELLLRGECDLGYEAIERLELEPGGLEILFRGPPGIGRHLRQVVAGHP